MRWGSESDLGESTILLTKTTATQNDIALSYHRVRGLHFLQLFLRRLHMIRELKGYRLFLPSNGGLEQLVTNFSNSDFSFSVNSLTQMSQNQVMTR